MTLKSIGLAISLGLAGAVAPLTASAGPAGDVTSDFAAAPTLSEANALRVVRDKATGKLRAPTADEAKSMDDAERAVRKARGLPEVAAVAPVAVTRRADGTLAARLGPEYLMTLKAERRADGSVRRFHDDGADHPVAAPHQTLPTE
jgi:hypothetical protein